MFWVRSNAQVVPFCCNLYCFVYRPLMYADRHFIRSTSINFENMRKIFICLLIVKNININMNEICRHFSPIYCFAPLLVRADKLNVMSTSYIRIFSIDNYFYSRE